MLKLRSSDVRGKCNPEVELSPPLLLLLLPLLRLLPLRLLSRLLFAVVFLFVAPRRRGDAPPPALASNVPPLPPAITCPRSSSARGERAELVSARERSVLLDPREAGRSASSSFSQLWILATPTRVAKTEPEAFATDEDDDEEDDDEPRPLLLLPFLFLLFLPPDWAFFPFFPFPIFGLKSHRETASDVSVEFARRTLASWEPTFGATAMGMFPLKSMCSSSRLSRSAAQISPAAFAPRRLSERSSL